jgi:hypothetical protein
MAHNIIHHIRSNKLITALIAILLSILLVGAMVFVTLSPQWAKASGLDPNKIIQLVNNERSKAGLATLSNNPVLTQAAAVKSSDMAAYEYFSHFRPSDNKRGLSFITDSGYTYQSAGENLAVYFETEEELVRAWMASPTHKKNILSTNYNETGIGISQGTYKGYGTSFVVQFFAKPLATETTQPTQVVTSTPQTPTPQPVSSASSSVQPVRQQPQQPTTTDQPSQSSSTETQDSQTSNDRLSQEEIDQLEQLLDKFFSSLRESTN